MLREIIAGTVFSIVINAVVEITAFLRLSYAPRFTLLRDIAPLLVLCTCVRAFFVWLILKGITALGGSGCSAGIYARTVATALPILGTRAKETLAGAEGRLARFADKTLAVVQFVDYVLWIAIRDKLNLSMIHATADLRCWIRSQRLEDRVSQLFADERTALVRHVELWMKVQGVLTSPALYAKSYLGILRQGTVAPEQHLELLLNAFGFPWVCEQVGCVQTFRRGIQKRARRGPRAGKKVS